MISSYDLAKALANKAIEIATANSHNLVPNNEEYLPSINEVYIQQSTIFGDDFPLGVADNSDDLQYGIYQVDVYTPKSNIRAEWQGLQIVELYKTGFKRGTELVYNNQMVRMKESTTRLVDTNTKHEKSTHLKTVLSVRYSVIN